MKTRCALGAVMYTTAWIGFNLSAQTLHLWPPASNTHPFQFHFNAAPGLLYDVETSTNLAQWEILTTLRARTAVEVVNDSNSVAEPWRFYRVADLSSNIVVEGAVDTIDPGYVLVSSSLDGTTVYTDTNGHYVLRTSAAAVSANVPFTLFFSKIGYRPHSVLVTNPVLPRVDALDVAGPSNNDFTNRFVISGTATGRDDNTWADVEVGEPGIEPSVWYSFVVPRTGTLRFVVDTSEFEPILGIFKGDSVATLQPVERGTISNYVEARIEKTVELSVFGGERLHIRVGSLLHPTRHVEAGYFDWRLTFNPGFRLDIGEYDPLQGTVTLNPRPNASGYYAPDTQVTVSAVPGTNFVFAGWTGSVNSASRDISLVINEGQFLQPHFQLANGDPAQATLVEGLSVQGQGFVPAYGVVWWSWRAPRDMPVNLLFDTTNYLYASVYAADSGTNLLLVANNRVSDDASVRFRATQGQTYKWAVNFVANQSGIFRFQLYEPIVVQGSLSASTRFTLTSAVLPAPLSFHGSSFEIWTRLPALPSSFPYQVTVSAPPLYYSATHTIRSNTAWPIYQLAFIGPSNNHFTNASSITGTTGSISGTLQMAGVEPGEPGAGENSVWYKYRPPQNGTLFLTTRGGVRDTTVWKGPSLSSLTLQPGLFISSNVFVTTEWTVNSGRENYIRLAGYQWSGHFTCDYRFVPGYPLYIRIPQTNAGTVARSPSPASSRYAAGAIVTLTATPKTGYLFTGWTGDIQRATNRTSITMNSIKVVQANFRLKNDHFTNAIVLSGLPVSAAGANGYGTSEPNEPDHCGLAATTSAWWKWTSGTSPRDVVLDFDYVDVTALISVYTGNSLSTLQLVANNIVGFNERQVRFRAAANAIYWIAVDAYEGKGGEFSFQIQGVNEARYRLEVPNVEGGYVVADPAPDGNGEYASGTWVTLWARPLNSYSFSQWFESSSGADVSLGATNGLRVRMDRSRVIEVEFLAGNDVRLNDQFADRQTIVFGAVKGTNVNATTETNEPIHSTNQSGHSLWWSWTAERTAPVALSTAGTSFRNVLAVYTGESLSGLTRVVGAASGEGTESRVWFNSVAGVTYHIAVDGLDGATGTVALRLAQNEDFLIEFLSPRPDASYAAPADIPIEIFALNSDLTVTRVDLFTNGALAGRRTWPPFNFTLSNVPPGVYQFDAIAVDVYGRTASVHGVSAPVTGFRFATNQFFASEADGVAQITLFRDVWTNAASVYVETAPVSATERVDYEHTAGSVWFLPYYNQWTFTIPIFWDTITESNETVEIVLRSGPGMPITGRALLTIRNSAARTAVVWFDDALPLGTTTNGNFEWVSALPLPASGALAHSGAPHGIVGTNTVGRLNMGTDGVLYQDVYLDPNAPPKAITISWGHSHWYTIRAAWGDPRSMPGYTTWMGPLPPAGGWYRLAIPGSAIGNVSIEFLEWNAVGGRAVWDRTVRVW